MANDRPILLVQSVVRDACRPICRKVALEGERFFTEFDEVAQSYIDFQSEYADTGNEFSVKARFSTNSTLTRRIIVSLESSDNVLNNTIAIGLEGSVIKVLSNGFTPGNGSVLVNDGRLHEVDVQINKSTGAISVFVDGALDYSTTHTTPSNILTQYIPRIGGGPSVTSGLSAGYFSGIISDVLVSDGNIFNSPVDQNYTPTNNTVIDRASGNNGTFINVADGDSTFYQLINGRYVDADGNAIEVAY